MGGKGSVMKQFNVMDVSKQKKHLLLYESYESFKQKCKAKFNISEDMSVFFVLEEDEDSEVDCDILEKVTPEKSVLIIKIRDQIYREENRTEQLKSREDCAKKDRNDQLQDNHTGEIDADRQGPSNIDNSSDFVVEEGIDSEVKEHLEKHGLKNIGDVLKRNLNKWKEIPLHIAVTGASGKGKSSFINALRGLTEQDPGAAKVDVRQCTKSSTPYKHPVYDNFVLWDVPGVGTTNFPKERYLEMINVDKYEFFIIVTTERFTETDSWLLREVKLRNKHCYIIRTKIDIDLTNEQRKVQGQFDELSVFIRLKQDLYQEMIDSAADDTKFDFFVISNHVPIKYDFPKLELQLLKDVPPAKKSAMVFGVAGMSSNVLKAKADALNSRIWKVAVMSGTGAAIPVPFLSTGLNVAIFLEEVLFYRSQFALDDKYLEKLAHMSGVTLKEMKEHLNLETPSNIFSTDGIISLLGKHVVDDVAKFVIPGLGTATRYSVFHKTTTNSLTAILQMMQNDAIKVLQYVAEKTCGNDFEQLYQL